MCISSINPLTEAQLFSTKVLFTLFPNIQFTNFILMIPKPKAICLLLLIQMPMKLLMIPKTPLKTYNPTISLKSIKRQQKRIIQVQFFVNSRRFNCISTIAYFSITHKSIRSKWHPAPQIYTPEQENQASLLSRVPAEDGLQNFKRIPKIPDK